MTTNFDVEPLLPRHTKKLMQSTQDATCTNAIAGQVRTRLDKNENLFGSVGTEAPYHYYPDSHCTVLRQELAEYQQLTPEQICIGNGSDELIDLIMRAFATPSKDAALLFTPAECRFKHYACLNNLTIQEVALNSFFQLPLYKAKQEITEHTKLAFISNPNPIAGLSVKSFDLVDFLDSFDGLVVIDESYIDYTDGKSFLPILAQYPKLIVVQTFSKAWGLAGLRIGAAYANPAIIKVLNTIKPPFNVNAVAQEYAVKALRLPEYKTRLVEYVAQERERVKKALAEFSFVQEIEESEANFLLVKFEDATKVADYLTSERIDVLNVSKLQHCENALRITIGKTEDNDKLLKALREMLSKTSPIRKFVRAITSTFSKAGIFLGIFKKIFS